MKDTRFLHERKGKGRPQILLVGNGLERGSGQPEWSKFLDDLCAPGRAQATREEKEKIPFPLLYQFLSTPQPAPSSLGEQAIYEEEKRLAEGLKNLKHTSNPLLNRLPHLGADHIFTTNYPYTIEAAFFPKRDFQKPSQRSALRFNLSPLDQGGKHHREVEYRLHTGYEAKNTDGSRVGLWHIHGETSVPRGIVVGHDRYGRLLSRMEKICSKELECRQNTGTQAYCSWPELFLFGDVYILGFGFATCEFDLWWLLRRKQRERFADGHVYFFDNSSRTDSSVLRYGLLESHGVQINPWGISKQKDYSVFYNNVMDEIAKQIRINKS